MSKTPHRGKSETIPLRNDVTERGTKAPLRRAPIEKEKQLKSFKKQESGEKKSKTFRKKRGGAATDQESTHYHSRKKRKPEVR